jgi:site-specific recombinase XerD
MSKLLKSTVNTYLTHCQTAEMQPKTIRAYSDILTDFVQSVGDIPVDNLTSHQVNSYIDSLKTRQGVHGLFAPSSIHKYYMVVHTFLKWMDHKGLVNHLIMDKINKPDLSENTMDILSDTELERLMAYLDEEGDFRNKVIFEILLGTGMHLRELSNLNLEEVNIDKKWVSLVDKVGHLVHIPLEDELAQHLDEYIVKYRKPKPNEKALIINRSGTRLMFDGLEMLVKRVLKEVRDSGKSGGETLRNTFSITFLKNGGKDLVLYKILRNTDINSIQRCYDHLRRMASSEKLEGDRLLHRE